MSGERKEPARAKRIVVKVGSGVLTNGGSIRSRVVGEIARQVAELRDAGRDVVVVSSGAVAMGARTLGWDHPGRSILSSGTRFMTRCHTHTSAPGVRSGWGRTGRSRTSSRNR